MDRARGAAEDEAGAARTVDTFKVDERHMPCIMWMGDRKRAFRVDDRNALRAPCMRGNEGRGCAPCFNSALLAALFLVEFWEE